MFERAQELPVLQRKPSNLCPESRRPFVVDGECHEPQGKGTLPCTGTTVMDRPCVGHAHSTSEHISAVPPDVQYTR